MRMRTSLLLVVLATLLAGCAGTPPEHLVPANMPELKAALGVLPEHAPPIAKAQASTPLARVGETIRFTSEGTSDPQGLPLTHVWTFGDGATAEGASVTYAFTAAGEHLARLTVTNAAGLADHDVVPLRITPLDQPPVPALRVQPADVVQRGERVTFDASSSLDPEGGPLAYEWTFGDGATSRDAVATHAYEKAGRYAARLLVRDAAGATATAEQVVRVGASYERAGTFTLTDAPRAGLDLPVAAGVSSLHATLTFDGALGANDLTLVLLDAAGAEVARARTPTPPGAQGEQTRALALDAAALEGLGVGTWRLEVLRESASPAGAAWSLVVRLAG